MSAERLLLSVLLVGLAVGCVLVLQPFLSAILWAAILVFTTWPVCRWLRLRVGLGRPAAAAVMVLLTAVLYAIAPFIIALKLKDVPSLGTITLALFGIGLGYLPAALLTQHDVPTIRATVSLLLLGVVCTALAFVAFFALIREVGPVRAPLFTYVNPVVAIVLGAVVLAEPLTPGLLIGFPIVLIGCWFAATGGRLRPRPSAPDLTTGPVTTVETAQAIVADPARPDTDDRADYCRSAMRG